MSGESNVELRIEVRPSLATNDHEVCLPGNGKNLIVASGLMGLDPNHLLGEPCRLRAQLTSHVAIIGRCRCGEVGCSNIEVEINKQTRWSRGKGPTRPGFNSTRLSTRQKWSGHSEILAGKHRIERQRALFPLRLTGISWKAGGSRFRGRPDDADPG